MMPNLNPVFEDDHLLVVNKPSGMAIHRGWSGDRQVLVKLVRDYTGLNKAHPVGRLDRGTSGVVVFAKSGEMAAQLQVALAREAAVKRYLALVRGQPQKAVVVDHPLAREKGGEKVPARTDLRTLFTVQAEPREVSLVEALIHTGRVHQIRRHLKHISHPVIGDANYGKGPLNRAICEGYGLCRLALHAASVTFTHPATGEELTCTAPIPEDLAGPLARMGFPRHHFSPVQGNT